MRFQNLDFPSSPTPIELPVTIEEFKEHARLKGITLQVDPGLLNRELRAATTRAESWMRRTTIERELKALYMADSRGTAPQAIALPRGRVASVVSVVIDDGQPLPPEGYKLNDWGVITLAQYPLAAATVNWISGYGPAASDVPDLIKEGILEYATTLYEDRRGNREIKATSDVGLGVPPGVADLWRPFQIEISG